MSEFEKIIGYEDIKAELARYASVLRNPEKYAKLGVVIPSGILLSGEPGLGKTLMAKCFIAETGCKVFELRKEKPNGDFVNHIKETFEAAKKEEDKVVIVFLDDMDKFANEDENHPDAEEYVTVQSCIDDCKGHGVFVLATANNKYCFPESLLRAGRFDKVIEVERPRGIDAERIVNYYLKQKQLLNDLDIEEISKILEDRSCAEIETIINDAGIYAGYDGRDRIEHADVIKACVRMMFDSSESISMIQDSNNPNIRNVAVHEAGHAVIAEFLNPGSVTLVSICRHSGSIKGVTRKCTPDEYDVSKECQEKYVIMGLGGKAATEMVYGVADVGCMDDMSVVFRKVSMFVDSICSYGFYAHEIGIPGNPSQYLLENKNIIVSHEIERYYQTAKRIIAENREFFDAIVEALIEHKTITYREMQRIRERYVKAIGGPL